jgi:hypothetical protein
VLAVVGCAGFTGSREPRTPPSPSLGQSPTAENLISYVNRNAAKVESLEATDLGVEVKQGGQGGGLSGALYCQKPKNFRLRAKAVGKPVADFGSNDQEFWYWISQDNPPYLYHCNYTDLSQNNVQLPFPFQPDWVLETLGMATINAPAESFRVAAKGDHKFELVESSTSLQGKMVYKVTVFDTRATSGTAPQIVQHRLHDDKTQLVAVADILSVRRDAQTGATVPTHLKLRWPQQQIEMELKLDGLKVYAGPVVGQRSPDLFVRQKMRDVQSFDLATKQVDAVASGLQRTGGFPQR